MPQALIEWDGNPGPYDALSVGVGVTVANVDTGGEFQWDFTLVRKPLSSAAVLAGAGNSRTLVPDVEGTYVVNIVVNNDPNLADESAAAVLYYPSGLREPAPLETLEWDSTNGWSSDPALHAIWERANHGVGVQPAASATVWGRLWHVPGGAGVADTFEICLKDSSDVYNWVDVTGVVKSDKVLTIVDKTFANDGETLTLAELNDTYIRVDTTGGPTNLFLPNAPPNGTRTRVKLIGANDLTLTPLGGDTIELAALLTFNIIRMAYAITYVTSATDWEIF